jgi:hypothetical protein
VLAHLAVSLADGGDCLADIAVLRNQPGLFGEVASDPTVFRVLDSIDRDGFGFGFYPIVAYLDESGEALVGCGSRSDCR